MTYKLKKQAISDLPSDLSNKAGISLNNLDSTGESHFQSPIVDLDTIRSGATAGSTAVQPSSLAAVATSGSYSDLSNKPTIPTVNNATLTIQKNGTTVNTFTANASSNVTCNITVPTTAADVSAEPAISLTASRALISNSSGKVAVSSITSTKLGYLTDVTSNIQAQIDGKQATLVSGTNIKTINGSSILDSGNLVIENSSGGYPEGTVIAQTWGTWTAPDNGFACANAYFTNGDNNALCIYNETTGMGNSAGSWLTGFLFRVSIPVKKGDVVTATGNRIINYTTFFVKGT